MICFGWVVAMFTLYSVFHQTPIKDGGYGFTPLQRTNEESKSCGMYRFDSLLRKQVRRNAINRYTTWE